MQLFLDFLPLLAFFVAYKLGDIYLATKALMVAMVLLCIINWLRTRKISGMLLTSTLLALVAGGITLALHNPIFLKWKLTLLDAIFALAFFIAPYVSDKTLVERVMGSAIQLQAAQWRILNRMWMGFFIFTASLNVYVLYHFSEATWVNFKVYGTLVLTLIFVVLQAIWLSGKLPKEPASMSESDDSQEMNGS